MASSDHAKRLEAQPANHLDFSSSPHSPAFKYPTSPPSPTPSSTLNELRTRRKIDQTHANSLRSELSRLVAMAAEGLPRKSLAPAALVLAAAVVAMAWLAAPAAALVPYAGGHGMLWDLLDDPFRVLEQSPFSAPAAPRAAAAAGGEVGVALARCDWKETPEAHVISVDVPGVRREDVRVEVEENSRVLRVSGERRADEDREGERWHRAERAAGRFWRRFRMPAGADVDRVSARLENGVLTVTVPKVAEHRRREPRVISIAGADKGGAEAAEVKASKAEM
ncbi:hypothetical protein ACP70R_004185 [Stipagrostis hirtigluma subsp. patula]